MRASARTRKAAPTVIIVSAISRELLRLAQRRNRRHGRPTVERGLWPLWAGVGTLREFAVRVTSPPLLYRSSGRSRATGSGNEGQVDP